MNDQRQEKKRSGTRRHTDEPGAEKKPAAPPHEVDGTCSRCGGRWPCLRCLISTPPFVRIHNNF